MEQSLEVMAGVVFVVLGLSLLLRAEAWVDWFEGVRAGGQRLSLAIGMLHLFFGALIVALHQVWSGWGLLLTVIGLWAIGEGTLYLLFPKCLAKIIEFLGPYRGPVLRISGLAGLILAAALLYPYCHERCGS